MIDHVSIQVSDLARSVDFYSKALAPVGYTVIMKVGHSAGLGARGKPDLWLEGPAGGAAAARTLDPVHVAVRSKGRAEVRSFHAAALAAGGKDNGAPGVRAHYHPDYYGAFVLDPDGHNLEVVCHEAYLD